MTDPMAPAWADRHRHVWTWAEPLGLPGQHVWFCERCGRRKADNNRTPKVDAKQPTETATERQVMTDLEAAILRAVEALHRERWPNEGPDYDPARDPECRPIIAAAVRAAVAWLIDPDRLTDALLTAVPQKLTLGEARRWASAIVDAYERAIPR